MYYTLLNLHISVDACAYQYDLPISNHEVPYDVLSAFLVGEYHVLQLEVQGENISRVDRIQIRPRLPHRFMRIKW